MTTPAANASFDVLWKKIRSVRSVMLIVSDPNGNAMARPMTIVQDDFSGSIWFYASASAPPASLLLLPRPVILSVADPSEDLFVSLRGTATLDHDRERIHEFWSPMVKAWFAGGETDPDLILIRVDVDDAEYWDVAESKVSQLYKLAKAALGGTPPKDLGKHGYVNVR